MRLSDLTSADAIQRALDEFAVLGQDAFLQRYGYGKASNYLVMNPRSKEWADSKAIAGVALGFQFPEVGPLSASDFSGGEATVQAKLQGLGFEVRRLSEIAGSDWTEPEVALIVADYLAMLTQELTGQRFNKAERRRRLMQQLPGRSEGSVEFKHANISAVMLELGFPYLRGYKPRANFQRRRLVDEVSRQVSRHSLLDEAALAAVQRPALVADQLTDFGDVRADAPKRDLTAREPDVGYFERRPFKRDYLEREAQNRSLGLAGEEFALSLERWRLVQSGCGQLAERVEHTSKVQGDGTGFDIRSFECDGSDRYIEVKTTSFGDRTPFFVSSTELAFGKSHPDSYRIYRLFDFRKAPRMFELVGPLDEHCLLDATTYKASFS
jgi:hypothetical protein